MRRFFVALALVLVVSGSAHAQAGKFILQSQLPLEKTTQGTTGQVLTLGADGRWSPASLPGSSFSVSGSGPITASTTGNAVTVGMANPATTPGAFTVNGNFAVTNPGGAQISSLTPKGVMSTDSVSDLVATALNNGQLLIGSTGAVPVAGTISQTANQISVANGAGTITLSLPNAIVTPGSLQTTGLLTDSGGGETISSVASGSAVFDLYGTQGYLRQTVPTTVTSYAVTWPSAQGTGVLTNNGSGTLTWAAAAAPALSSVLATGSTTGANNITFSAGQGWVLTGATNGTYTITPPATSFPASTAYAITWPNNNGSNGQCLTTNGSNPGAMSWQTIGLAQACVGNNQVNGVTASEGITWTTGGTFSTSAPEISGPSDQGFYIQAGTARALVLSSNGGSDSLTLSSAGLLTHPGGINWATGGSYAAGSTSEIYGPTDTGLFISSGTPASAGNGQALTLTAAAANGSNVGGASSLTGGAGTNGTGQGNPAGGNSSVVGGASTGQGLGGTASLIGGAFTGSTGGSGGPAVVAGGAGSTSLNNSGAGGVLVQTGKPTGSGTANIQMQSGWTLGSSGTAQTYGDRLYIAGHNVTMSTTTAQATTIAVLNLPTSGSGGGVFIHYFLVATDGTNYAVATGSFNVSAANKSGTVVATAGAITGEASENDGGSYAFTAATISETISSQAVSIKLAPTWSTLSATSVICTVTLIPFGNGVTVTAQ